MGDEARSTCAQAQLTECWVKRVIGSVWVCAGSVGVCERWCEWRLQMTETWLIENRMGLGVGVLSVKWRVGDEVLSTCAQAQLDL